MSECLIEIVNKLKDYNKNKAFIIGYSQNLCSGNDDKYKKVKQEVEYIDFCLTLISATSKEILEMIYFKNMSLSDISRVFCVCKGTIQYRKEKALKEFIKIYK